MTIIQLQYLLAVANCGSFSLAAKRSFVPRPSLSMQIKALEEELGVVLLDHTKKSVILTIAPYLPHRFMLPPRMCRRRISPEG